MAQNKPLIIGCIENAAMLEESMAREKWSVSTVLVPPRDYCTE